MKLNLQAYIKLMISALCLSIFTGCLAQPLLFSVHCRWYDGTLYYNGVADGGVWHEWGYNGQLYIAFIEYQSGELTYLPESDCSVRALR